MADFVDDLNLSEGNKTPSSAFVDDLDLTEKPKPSLLDRAKSFVGMGEQPKREMTVSPEAVQPEPHGPMTAAVKLMAGVRDQRSEPLLLNKGSAGTAFIRTMSRVPENLLASGVKAVQGKSGASVVDQDLGDRLVSWVEDRNRALAQEYSDEGFISRRDVAEQGPNLGFSGISMGAGIGGGVVGGLAGSVVPGPGTVVGGVSGSMAASGTAAYRMQTYSAMMDWLNKINQESIQKTGKPITPKEEAQFKKHFDTLATKSGLWEAGPEAVGNVLEIALMAGKGTLPGRLASLLPKGAAGKAIKGVARAAGIVGTEEATETITQHGQHNVEVDAGMSKDPKRSWTSGDDLLKSAGEVLPGVLFLSGFMTAGGAGYRKLRGSKESKKMIPAEERPGEQTPAEVPEEKSFVDDLKLEKEEKTDAPITREKPEGDLAEHQGTDRERPPAEAVSSDSLEQGGKVEEAPPVEPRRVVDEILSDLDEVLGKQEEIKQAKAGGEPVSKAEEKEVTQKAEDLKTELTEAVKEERKPSWEKKEGILSYDDVKDIPYTDIIRNVPAWRMKVGDYRSIPRKKGLGIQKKDGVLWAHTHKNEVEKAIAEGKDIPDEVLDDYPDLKKAKVEEPAAPLEEAKSGGWKESDKVPEKYRKPTREQAIERYVKHHADRGEKNVDRRKIAEEYIQAIEDKDVAKLRKIMNGINPEVNRLFTAVTGLPAKTQKEADASIRSLDPERWDAWKKENAEKREKETAQREADTKKQQLDAILNKQGRDSSGNVMTMREFYDRAIKEGFNTVTEHKNGALSTYRLVNTSTGKFYPIKKKIEADYVRERIGQVPAGTAEKPKLTKDSPPFKKGDKVIVQYNGQKFHATVFTSNAENTAVYPDVTDETIGVDQGMPITLDNSYVEIAPSAERRRDFATRKRVSEMTDKEKTEALLRDDKTGLFNERAFQEAPRKPYVAYIDGDSLGAINDNFGHAAGDALLKLWGDALTAGGIPETYHLHGDELAIEADSPAKIDTAMNKAYSFLAEHPIEVVSAKDGQTYILTGGLSYGISTDKATADTALYRNKEKRLQEGSRAAKGSLPPGIRRADAGMEGNQNQRENLPESEVKPTYGSTNKIFTEDKAAKAREILKAKLSGQQLNMGLDPEIISAGIDLAGYHIEAGARSFADYTKAMVADIGENIRPYLKSFYLAVRNYPGFDKTGMNTETELDAIDENSIDNEDKGSKIYTGEKKDEPAADGGTGPGSLESNQPESLSGDGGGQSSVPGERGSGEADTQGNGDIDEGRDDEGGGLAGEPAPIHLQDGGSDSESVPSDTPAVTPPSEPRTKKLTGVNPGNYRITESDNIGAGTRGQKIDANLAAIRLIKQLDKEGRYPTKEEQATLAKYVGWGGLKSVFDKDSTKPQDIRAREELESILTKEEYLEAFVSMTNAHYTSPEVIKTIYKVMQHFGLTGGNILEPTYGAGNFIGLMPDDLAASSKWYGSELDIITAKIGQYLYPDAQLIQSGFQEAEFPYGKFDAAVGNPPFGDERIADTRKTREEINRFKIHNYVISKSGMHLKPGGVMGMVITSRFLDTADPEARDFLSKQFQFLGAIRLPNDAFSKNAGTEVTTDIVFLRRFMPDEASYGFNKDWLETGATMINASGEEVTLNRYFVNRPELMLGEPSMKGTMYGGAWKEGGKGEFTLDKREGQAPTDELIDTILENQFADLKGIMQERADDKVDAAALSLTINKEDVGIGGYYLDGDTVYMRGDDDQYGNPSYSKLTEDTIWSGSLTPNGKGGYSRVVTKAKKKETVFYNSDREVPASLKLGETRLSRIKGMLKLREMAYDLVKAERFDLSGIEERRTALNSVYDAFVKEHGFLSESANFSLMSDDVKIEFGLETGFKKEITPARSKALGIPAAPASADKATILKERMFYPDKEILYAKNPLDGYNISLQQKGRLDLDYITNLTGLPKDDVIDYLAAEGVIYKDPDTGEWIQEDDYLSGNVKEKYRKVEGKEGFEKNAEALKKVFPPDKPTERIYAQLGSPWIPAKYYEQFGQFVGLTGTRVMIYKDTGNFSMNATGTVQNDVNLEWKNDYFSIDDLCNAAANNKSLIAYDGKGDDRVQNKEQTKVIANIVQSVRKTFADWVYADEARSKDLTKIYNETQNTNAPRRYDGRHLETVGANPAVILRNTQRNAAWRMIQSSKVLLDHCVGAGKTFTIITGVQERVRMGLSRKAMIVVPNHLVGQWAADYIKLYPGARILAATKKDFTKSNRRRLFARIATGKYDAVIVGHSSFGFIPIETETLTNLIMEEIQHLESAHAEAKREGNKRLIKSLAKRIQKKRERIKELIGRARDNVTTFEAMGIDHLIVDESHEFKNLEYSSAMQNITGMGNPMGSKKAFDLYSKVRWLATQKDSSLTFATGTPISNSLVEMYALFRYMNRDALVSRGVDAFDSWAKSYAAIEPKIEYTASQKLKERTIMSTFNNLSEMLQIYNEFSDTVTLDDLKRIYAEQIRERNLQTGGNEREEFPIPKIDGGGRALDVAEATEEQAEYVDYLVARAERLEKEGRQADPKIDNHLWIMSDARKMALDIRLVDPSAPDNPNNKINRAAKSVKEIFDKTKDVRGTQLVFCDLSTPSGASRKNADAFIRDALKKAHLDGDRAVKIILDAMGTYQEKWGYIYNRLESELEAIADNQLAETDQYMKRREEIEEFIEKAADDVVADLTTADTGFSVYDELKSKLIGMGIPEGEIKFIHDANTEVQKQELFDLVNTGKVRILMGSSMKMGAGMNVQERLVALHHMDAPWRPSDVEQREGRIVRQGNSLYDADPDGFSVALKAYSTRNTFDAVMWQILARKGGMLDDFRNGADTVVDTSTDSASYSDFMAETTGNPAFKEKFRLEGEIEVLEAIKRRTQTRLRSAQQTINYNKDAKEKEQKSISRRDGILGRMKGKSEFTYKGKDFKDNAKDIVKKVENDYREYNNAVDKEYNESYDKAMKEAFAKAGIKIVERPYIDDYKSNDKYRSDFKKYEEFWSDEGNGKIAADAIKEIKKKPHKHLHYEKLAETDKSGVIAAGLEMLGKINALPVNGIFTFNIGEVDITVEKTESTVLKASESEAEVFDFVVAADGSFVGRERKVKRLRESDIWDILSIDWIRDNLESRNSISHSAVRQMDAQDEVSRDTLEKLKFKDEEKLKAKKERYAAVLEEVQKAEHEIDARRASVANKYISKDKKRFPRGYEPKPQKGEIAPPVSSADIKIDNIDLEALRKELKENNTTLMNWDNDDASEAMFGKEYDDLTDGQQLAVQDKLTFTFAAAARAEAILSQQRKDKNLVVAEDSLKDARDRWDDWHEGEEYPYEIKLAQHIITSIKNKQEHLFTGQLYSGLDPTQIVSVLKGLKNNIEEARPYVEALGRKVYAGGKKQFHEWRDQIKKIMGDLWKSFKSIMRDVWSKIREERGSISTLTNNQKEARQRIERNLKILGTEAQKTGVSLEEYMTAIGVPEGQISRLMEYAKALAAEKDTTGVKHAVVEEERGKAGKEPIKKQDPRGNEGMFQKAKDAVDSGEIDPRILAAEVAKKPRAINTEEEFALMYDRMRIKNELRDVREQIENAQKVGDSETETALLEKRNNLESDLDINDQATTHGGSEVGRSLQARTRMVNEDYSLEEILLRARQDNGGKPLSEEMRRKYEAMAKEIEEANAKIKAYEEKISLLEAQRAVQKIKNDDVIRRHLGQAREKRAAAKSALDREFKDLTGNLNAVLGGLHFNFDPTAIKIMVLMARNRIKAGIMTPEGIVNEIYDQIHEAYPEIDKRDIRDAISGYGKTFQLSKDEIDVQLREAKQLMRLISSYEDAVAGISPLHTGLQRDKMSDQARELGRKVRQAMRESGIDSGKSEEEQWKTSLDAVKTRLRNQIHDLTKQIQTGERTPKKIGIKYDAEAEALRAQRDRLKDVLISIEGKPEISPEQKIKMAMSAVEKSIAEYERRIQEKDLSPKKTGSGTPETPELKQLREKRDALKDIYADMQKEAKPKKSPEEIALKSYKTRMTNRMKELEEKLEKGDFSQKQKKETKLDDEGLTLKHNLDRVIYKYKEARLKDQLARRSTLQKIGGGIAETANFMRSVKASMDVSAVFRQGLFTVVSHPVIGAKAIIPMLKAFKNDKYRFEVEQDILNRPNYKLYQDAGLDLTDIGTDLTTMEETFMSRLAEKIPGVAGSQRAYTTFLNKIRVDSFDLLIKNLVKSEGTHTTEEAKAIATLINESTGRGKVGMKPNTLSGLNTIFFAPRLVASRFQMLVGHSAWKGSKATRKLIAKEYGRFLAGISVIYLLAQLGDFDIEWDPRSSDFGKIKIGNVRIDPLGGFAQVIVFSSRVLSGKTKTASGVIRPIRGEVQYGQGNTADVIWRFIRTKLSPAIGLSIDAATGTDVVGKKVTVFDPEQMVLPDSLSDIPTQLGKVSSLPEKAVAPMAMVDTYEAIKDRGIPEGLALGTLGMLGIGIQVHEKDSKQTLKENLRKAYQEDDQSAIDSAKEAISDAHDNALITDSDKKRILKDAKEDAFVSAAKKMPLPALEAMIKEDATDEQKEALYDVFKKKVDRTRQERKIDSETKDRYYDTLEEMR